MAGMIAIVIFDMFAINKRYLNTNSFSPKPLSTANQIDPRPADLMILKDKDPNYRVMDVSRFGDAMPSYFHKCIGGYHAAKLTRYQDLISHQIEKNNFEVLNMLNAKYFIFNDTTVQQNPEALGNCWFVDTLNYVNGAKEEMDALSTLKPANRAVADKAFEGVLGKAITKSPGDTIYETSYKPNELRYTYVSKNGGLAVFSEIFFPWGWNATIDGKEAEIGRVNYVLRALNVPAGKHEIVFRFDPQSTKTSQTIAFVAIAAIYLAMIAAVLLYKKPEENEKEQKD